MRGSVGVFNLLVITSFVLGLENVLVIILLVIFPSISYCKLSPMFFVFFAPNTKRNPLFMLHFHGDKSNSDDSGARTCVHTCAPACMFRVRVCVCMCALRNPQNSAPIVS